MQVLGYVGKARPDSEVERRCPQAGRTGHGQVAGWRSPRCQPVVEGAGPHGSRGVQTNVADADNGFRSEFCVRGSGGFDQHKSVCGHEHGRGAVTGDSLDPLVGWCALQPFLEFLAQGVPMRHGAAFGRDVQAPPIRGNRSHVVRRQLVEAEGVVDHESTRC